MRLLSTLADSFEVDPGTFFKALGSLKLSVQDAASLPFDHLFDRLSALGVLPAGNGDVNGDIVCQNDANGADDVQDDVEDDFQDDAQDDRCTPPQQKYWTGFIDDMHGEPDVRESSVDQSTGMISSLFMCYTWSTCTMYQI